MWRMSINGAFCRDFSTVRLHTLVCLKSRSKIAGMEFLVGCNKFIVRVTFCFLNMTLKINNLSIFSKFLDKHGVL